MIRKGLRQRMCVIILMAYFFASRATAGPIVWLDMTRYALPERTDSLTVLDIWDEMHCAATLQGIVNRKKPQLYMDFIQRGSQSMDHRWWDYYRTGGRWLSGRDTLAMGTLDEAVGWFRKEIKGAVIYDGKVASTSCVASAVAGIEDLVAVRYDDREGSLYSRLVSGGLTLPVKVWLVAPDGSSLFTGSGRLPGCDRESSGSVKCDPYLWFIEKYMKTGACNGHFAGYYIDQDWRKNPRKANINHHTLTNHDFFASKKGFFFDLSPWEDEAPVEVSTLREMLSEARRLNHGRGQCYVGGFPAWAFKYTDKAGGSHGSVHTEWKFNEILSEYGAFEDADAIGYGALANASFWQHFPLKGRYPQKRSNIWDLKKRGLVKQDGSVDTSRNYILVYMGDYDASSWISQALPGIWDSPSRGRLPMMWCISPVLSERVPHILSYLRETASPNDYFAAADNGAGYMMPGVAEEKDRKNGDGKLLRSWKRHCTKHYRRWGYTVTGFIIDGTGPAMGEKALDAYSSFSPDGIVPQKCPEASLHGQMPVLRAGIDLTSGDPAVSAEMICRQVSEEPLPFHWFRCILKSPEWYNETIRIACEKDPSIVLLDAPSYFNLLRVWLKSGGGSPE